jgi:hypothetical protein
MGDKRAPARHLIFMTDESKGLSPEQEYIIENLTRYQIGKGFWKDEFFKDKTAINKLLSPKVIDKLVKVNLLGTSEWLQEILKACKDVCLSDKSNAETKIRATEMAVMVTRMYLQVMDRLSGVQVVKKTGTDVSNETEVVPTPEFYDRLSEEYKSRAK